MIARPFKKPALEKSTAWVKLDAGATLPQNQRARLALIVRAYRTERPVACGCLACDATIHPGEWFTMGNQHDGRGRYPRCYACMPFESVKGDPR